MPSQEMQLLTNKYDFLSFFFEKTGTVGFENQVNKCLELAEYLYAKIKTEKNLRWFLMVR